MQLLTDKVAIVTGASSGIGRAAALLFARHGAKVIAAARRNRELEDVVETIEGVGGTARACAGDVSDEAFAQELVDTATGEFGGLDVAFNNAGTVGELGPVPTMALANWNDVVATNLTSAFLGAKYQLPALAARGRGSLIFTYGSRGIRVNALLPGGTDTPMGRGFADSPERAAFVRNLHALKRIASPEEIASAALFLASELSSLSSFTTGSALLVDGGVSIART
jgi:NAD(P)-dependent dehydrogenase (short-subunit alcohol dehydrogenase family)